MRHPPKLSSEKFRRNSRSRGMRILTKEEACKLLNDESLDAFVAQLSGQLRLVKGTFSAPVSSGKQIVVSKLFAYVMLKDSPVCLYLTGWGIATEHLDLFYGYRRSLGETRPLIEAPVHVFEKGDTDAFVSLLCVSLFFSWDAAVFDLAGKCLLQTSHDGWLEYRANDEAFVREVVAELERYQIPL